MPKVAGGQGNKSVSEKIDERILRILGLKDTFDLDYSDYSSLLKEKMVTISMGKSGLSREEEMLVRDEFKRVKGKTGKFKATKTKIGADSIKTEVKKTPSYYKSPFAKEQETKQQKVKPNNKVTALSTYVEKPKISTGALLKKESSALAKPIQDYGKKITKVATILETSQKQENKFEIEKKKDDIKEKDEKKKADIESSIERKIDLPSLPKLSIPLLNPVKSLFSRIFDALKILVAGWLVDKALIWINNPENQKKMQAVGDWFVSVGEWLDSDETKRKIGIITGFLKRHWLAIFGVGGIMLLWSNGIVRFTAKLTKRVLGATARLAIAAAKMGGSAVMMAAKFARRNPKAAATFAAAAGVLAYKQRNKLSAGADAAESYVKEEVVPKAKGAANVVKGIYQKGSEFVDAGDRFFGVGQYTQQQNEGGVTGFKTGGTVPVILTRGEVVIAPNKAKQIGYDKLHAMNSLGDRRNEGGPIVPLNAGGGVKVVPGRGPNVDSVRDRLPVGSFVIQRPAVDAMGGPSAIRGYNQGGFIIGDSIAQGMANVGGQYGGERKEGAQPLKVLDFIRKIPQNNLKGKPVLLSTGATNAWEAGGDISTIDKQLKYLKDAGAKVAVAGVAIGPKTKEGYQPKLGNINSTLKSKSEQYGFGFGGGFTAGKDGIHPTNYPGFKSNLEKSISKSSGETTDPTKGGAINTIAQIGTPAQRALLDTISFAEGTYTKNREQGYKIMFTGKRFDAPPWKHPEKLNSGGGYTSDAAGRYQFLSTTWKRLKLPDFTPNNQDKGALQLIQNRYGAYQSELESKGLTDNLMNKISGEWASFPTLRGASAYGQPVKKADTLRKKYNEILGGAGAGVGANASTATGTNTTGGSEGTSSSTSTNPLDFFSQLYNFVDVLEGRAPSFPTETSGSTTSTSGSSGGADLTAGPIAPGPMHQKGANIAKELMRLLNIKDYQAAGIVGNLIQESSLVPDRIQGSGMRRGTLKIDGVTGYSYPQWTTRDRQQNFANYMQKKGHDWRTKGATDELATGFVATEFKDYMSSVFTGTKDTAAASNWVLKNYEKPADQGVREQQERAADSKAVLDKMTKGLLRGGIVQYLNRGGYAGGIQYFSTNDGRTNKILEPGKEYSYADTLWHHGVSPGAGKNARRPNGWPRDYTLLDGKNLSSSPNSRIPIPVDGEILDVVPSPGGGYGNHVIVKTGLGNMLFAHFSKLGNVKKGDKVSAGTILGVQGNTPGGMADHLHLEASEAGHAAFINYITTGKPITGSVSSGTPGSADFTPSTGEPSNPLDFFSQLYDYVDKLKPSSSQPSTSSPISPSTPSESKLTQNIQKVSSTPPSKTKQQSTSSVNTIPLPPEVVKTPPPPKSKEDAQKEKMGKPSQKTPTPSIPTYDGVTSSSGQGGFQWSYAEYFGVK